jgi:hypothetical protein
MELDELILHVHKLGDVPDERLTREINNRFVERTEIRPNTVVFHDIEEMRRLLGVGIQLKEQKVIDHRPKGHGTATPAPSPLTTSSLTAPMTSAKVPASDSNLEVNT